MTDLTNIGVKVEVHRSEDGTPNPMDGSENCFFLNGDTALRHKRQLQSRQAQQIIGTPREKISSFNVHQFYKQAENQLEALETVSVESDFIPNFDESMPRLELSRSINSDEYSFTEHMDNTCPDLGKPYTTTCFEKVDS